jgi:hypothetical protein
MKLYPLIYINEGARTSEEAVSKGVAAFITKKDSIVLFVVERVIDITKRFVEKYPSNARKSYHNEMLGTELAKRSIVAEITTTSVGDDLYKVESSAGVSKFGPLAYQLAMVNIYPSWLISDVSLTEDGGSADVWNKMYELSTKGVYERKWLGEFPPYSGSSPLVKRMQATAKGRKIFRYYKPMYETSEEAIQVYLEDHGFENEYSPYEFGFFYAYRLTNPQSVGVTNLFNLGDKVVEEMKTLGIDDPDEVLSSAAYEFFERRYD